jgi:hypothetical protein
MQVQYPPFGRSLPGGFRKFLEKTPFEG